MSYLQVAQMFTGQSFPVDGRPVGAVAVEGCGAMVFFEQHPAQHYHLYVVAPGHSIPTGGMFVAAVLVDRIAPMAIYAVPVT